MFHPRGQLVELCETDRGLNVRELEVETEDRVVVVATARPTRGASLILHTTYSLGGARIVCYDRTALPLVVMIFDAAKEKHAASP